MDAPQLQRRFVTDALPRIQQDARVAGVAIAGSLARGNPDVCSDVDLVIGFTGEHVGEPRLVITLVGPPLLHVDFKFMYASAFAERDEEPVILWDRDGSLAHPRSGPPPARAPLDLQWIEDRFWVWVHYGATKLGRGELFEVVSFLNYLRETVLAPLITHQMGAPARGVRHLEAIAPDEASVLRATVCGYDMSRTTAARPVKSLMSAGSWAGGGRLGGKRATVSGSGGACRPTSPARIRMCRSRSSAPGSTPNSSARTARVLR